MKKVFGIILCLLSVMFISIPAFAAGDKAETKDYVLKVNGQSLDTSDLPYSAYKEGETIMVPLRKVAEALGYDVTWISKKREITVEDSVQKAVISKKSNIVQFKGKLKVIDLSREIEFQKIAVHQKSTYVPIDFFKEFFNDVNVDDTSIDISAIVLETN